jgi:hypothetical protein
MAEVVAAKNGIQRATPVPVADGKAAWLDGGAAPADLPAICSV